jgi:chitinase
MCAGFVLGAVSCASQNQHDPSVSNSMDDSPRRIVGYVTGRSEIWRIDPNKLTHINFAFASVSESGEVILPSQAGERLAQLQALKARNPALKIIVSVGGWGADHFSDAALNDESRDRFAKSVVTLIKRFELDGIDLDWEYPGQPGPGIKYRQEDKPNFTLLLKTIRHQLDHLSDQRHRAGADRYLLTIATADHEYFDHTEMDKLHVYVDWCNIMAYDFYNSLTTSTGHHAGLYRAATAPADSRWAEASVRQHLAAGIPPAKLVLGVAFYARAFSGIEKDPPVNQPYAKYCGDYSYSRLVTDFINRNGFERRWDDVAKAPYLWNPTIREMISYDDPQSLSAKIKFINQYHLGGVMYWEESQDPQERLLTVLYEGLTKTH